MTECMHTCTHTGDSRAVCESKDFYWGGIRKDQAVTDGQEVFCSILRGDAHKQKGGYFSSCSQLLVPYWLMGGLEREPVIVKLIDSHLIDRS